MTDKDASVRAVERALDILDCFGPDQLELSLTDLSRRINLAMSTTSRLVATLDKRDYLAKNKETQRYSLGPRIVQVGALGFSNVDMRKAALPFMRELNKLYDEGGKPLCRPGRRADLRRVRGELPSLRRVINVGTASSSRGGARGGFSWAYLPEDESAPSSSRRIPSRPRRPWRTCGEGATR